MRITLLGTGTSQGVPVIGCTCPVCTSSDPRDQRLRAALLIEANDTTIVVDVGPDFRQQILRAGIRQLDAVLLTHEHNDHVIGMDDLRPFIFLQKKSMPVYCLARVADELRKRFAYAFDSNPYPGAPSFEIHHLAGPQKFQVNTLEIQAIEYLHGQLPILGFRIGDFAYLTDFKTITDTEFAKLRGLDTLVISALHHTVHHSHANLTEALAMIARCKPRRAYLTHLSHRMGLYTEVEASLPPNVSLAYDGLQLEF